MVCGGIIRIQFGNPLLKKVEQKAILFNLILKEIKGYIFAQLFLKVDT
jgi:hypothetical protein